MRSRAGAVLSDPSMNLPIFTTLSRLNETSLHVIQVPDVNAHFDGMDSEHCLMGAVLWRRDPLRTMVRVYTSGIVTEPGVGYGMPKANLIAKALDFVQFGEPIWRMPVYNLEKSQNVLSSAESINTGKSHAGRRSI